MLHFKIIRHDTACVCLTIKNSDYVIKTSNSLKCWEVNDFTTDVNNDYKLVYMANKYV